MNSVLHYNYGEGWGYWCNHVIIAMGLVPQERNHTWCYKTIEKPVVVKGIDSDEESDVIILINRCDGA